MSLNKQTGFTIVEVMLAMVLGLSVVLAANSMHNSTRGAFKLSSNVLKMQSNARFAFDFIARDLQEAGSAGCRTARKLAGEAEFKKGNSGKFYIGLVDPTDIYANFRPGFDIEGYENGVGIPAGVVFDPLDLVPGTDALTIRGGLGRSYPVLGTVAEGGLQINLDLASVSRVDFQQGQHAAISSCSKANVFKITSSKAQIDAGIIQFGAGGSGTDNIASILTRGKGIKPVGYTNQDTSTEVRRMATRTYYLANNAEGVPSLFRDIDGGVVSPLVEGIQDMQIRYGDNIDGTTTTATRLTPDVYVDGGGVQVNPDVGSDFFEVKSVRIALLMRSVAPVFKTNRIMDLEMFGVPIADNDKYARSVFTTTVLLRNRAIGVRN